jgi:uncharacterized protein YbbK (DUF523 family)
VELGLGVPREPIRLVGRAEAARLLGERSGLDLTQAMRGFAQRRVEALAALDLSGYVTKAGSPSCGLARVEVHPDGGGAAERDGVGAFVRVLRERLPLLPIEEETALEDAARRERFVERVFAFDHGRGDR